MNLWNAFDFDRRVAASVATLGPDAAAASIVGVTGRWDEMPRVDARAMGGGIGEARQPARGDA